MTTAIWLIYLASVSERMLGFFVFFFCVSLLLSAFRSGVVCMMHLDGDGQELNVWPMWKTGVILAFGIPALFLSLIPDYSTALAMISIELGSDFLQSDEFQRVLGTVIPDKEG